MLYFTQIYLVIPFREYKIIRQVLLDQTEGSPVLLS